MAREALRFRANTFAFPADPKLKPADARRGRELWEERGGVPPLALVSIPAAGLSAATEDAAAGASPEQMADALAGVQAAVAAGAAAVVLEEAGAAGRVQHQHLGSLRAAGNPKSQRNLLAALARHAGGLPLLYRLQPEDFQDTSVVQWLLEDVPTGGWCLDAGHLFAAGWWQPERLATLGMALKATGRPGALWIAEPRLAQPGAGLASFGLGAMGLSVWWDLLSQPWTCELPIYVEAAVRPRDPEAELQSVRKLLAVVRGQGRAV